MTFSGTVVGDRRVMNQPPLSAVILGLQHSAQSSQNITDSQTHFYFKRENHYNLNRGCLVMKVCVCVCVGVFGWLMDVVGSLDLT